MKNYLKQQNEVFCTGQNLVQGSDNDYLVHNESEHYDLRGTLSLVPNRSEFEYLETSIQRLENEI